MSRVKSRRLRSARAAVRTLDWHGAALEALEDRRLLAVLTTGTGDGNLTVEVDGYGSFGAAVGIGSDQGAIYDPIGPISAASTTFQSGVALRFGSVGPRQFLTSGFIFGTSTLPSIPTTGSATSIVSNFSIDSLAIELTQTVSRLFNSANVQTGSYLTQRYVITNTSSAPVNFELVRYIDGDLLFDGSLYDGGGRLLTQGREFLFETDAGGGGETDTTFFGIDATGGTIPTSGRFELESYSTLGNSVASGAALNDTIWGDFDGDGFIDAGAEYDVTLALRNVFTLAPGATASYTTRTVFGSGQPDALPEDPVVSIVGDASGLEGDSGLSPIVFSVTVDRAINSPLVVGYTVEGITATEGVDFPSQNGFVTFVPGGPSTLPITVLVNGDPETEMDETFRLRLTDASGGAFGRAEAIGTILNDDVELRINDITIVEGNSGTKDAVFTVSTVGAVSRSVTVGYTTVNGTATAGSDYLARGGVLTLLPGMTSATIVVPIIGDVFNELDETFSVVLVSANGGRIIDGLGIGTILNNDPLPNLYVNDPVVTSTIAGAYQAVFTVALDAPSGRDVQVAYSTAGGGAIDGVDYLGTTGTLHFAPGVTTLQVSVPVMTLGAYSSNKKFYLNLHSPWYAQLVDAQGAATIVYDDGTDGEYIVDDGGIGYSKSPGWTTYTNTLAYQLDYDTAPAGNGGATATWSFVGIPNGSYQVFARWSHFSNRATNAPFTMLDNGVPVATVLVNQQLAPAGEYSDGVYWQSLGTFDTTTNNFAVRLSNAANGYVVADAIRLVAGGIAPQNPEMDIAANELSITTGDATPELADNTHFGTAPIFQDSNIHKFTIVNNGNADLLLTGVPRVTISGAHAGDFHVITQPASLIAPGRKTSFEIMFHPLAAGLRTATVTIANNDDTEHPYTFVIHGNGHVDAVPLAHNAAFPQDVNDDGRVNTSDALIVINSLLTGLNTPAAQPLAAAETASPLAAASTTYVDVNADGRLNSSDLLMVFNYLLLHSTPKPAPQAAEPLTAEPLAAEVVDKALVLFRVDEDFAEAVAAPVESVTLPYPQVKLLPQASTILLDDEQWESLLDDESDEGETSAAAPIAL